MANKSCRKTIVHWRQANFNSNCQLVCVKGKVKVFSIDDDDNDNINAAAMTIHVVL